MAIDEEIFQCFESHAVIDGKRVPLGVEESSKLARSAVFQGMTGEDGNPKEVLSWLEEIVVQMRASTTEAPYNHEWWANEVSKPEWARLLDRFYGESWLYFPESPEDLNALNLGNKLGYKMALDERAMELATSQQSFLEKMESVELEKARRGFDADEAAKIRVVIPGYDSRKEFADDEYASIVQFRKRIFQIVNERATREETEDFYSAYSLGAKRARAIDLENQLSEFNEQNEVVEILQDNWLEIETLQNRAQISELIWRCLSSARKEFLQGSLPTKGNISFKEGPQWQTFTGRLRDIYRKIGLGKAGKGRPRKNGGVEEV